MNFTCTQTALVKAINTVSKAVSSRTTIPILKGILLEVKEGKLVLSASDMDLSIQTGIDVQVKEEGSAVVSSKLFGDIVRKLPNSIIEIFTEGQNLCISCLGSKFSIVSLPAEEFPVIGTVNSLIELNLKKEDLCSLIKSTVFSASIDDKKGILTGCLVSFEENYIETVALDGFRMSIARKEAATGAQRKIVVPARILYEISRIVSEDQESDTVSMIIDEKKTEIRTQSTRITARLLEGDFIDYKRIIPKDCKTRVICSREDLLSSIERASLLAKEGKNNLIKLEISDDSIIISSRSEEGNVNESLGADKTGEDIVIGFNSKYIIDLLKNTEEEEIAIELWTSVSACLIKPVEGDYYTYLVLPVRIASI